MTKALPVDGLKPNRPFAENARKILKIRVAEFYALASVADQEFAIEALHNLRIAAKRLRYTLELFAPAFGDAAKLNIERLKVLQEELGTIHDIDVRTELIRDELKAEHVRQVDAVTVLLSESPKTAHRAILTAALRPPPDDPRRGLYSLLSRQALDRRDTYRRFVECWTAFDEEGMRTDLVEMTWEPRE